MEYLSGSRSLDPDEVKEGINDMGVEGLYLLDGVCHIEKIGMGRLLLEAFRQWTSICSHIYKENLQSHFVPYAIPTLTLTLTLTSHRSNLAPLLQGVPPPTHGNQDDRPQQPPSGQSPREAG